MTNRTRQATVADARAIAKASVAALDRRLEALDSHGQPGVVVVVHKERQAAIDALAEQIIELHDRLVEVEITKGIRTSRPVRKANASFGERWRAMVADLDNPSRVRKNGGPVSWEGFF